MYYFVIDAEGNRYGPADIDTLVRWVQEGRIVASTVLVERGTERRVQADSITAIAAALRRVSGQAAGVAIERDEPISTEAPTVPQVPDGAGAGLPSPGPPVPPVPRMPPVAGAVPPEAGYARRGSVSSRSRLVAGLLGIFLGGLGIHRFYLGYNGIGLLMLLLSVSGGIGSFFCIPGAGCGIIGLWGLIEGIVCLCGGMRDADGLELRD
ncbi:MAG: TM2 domain-containing protein [Phycisphaerae bacterium]|nr:TM2 domain-containing protein [Phycisphaerae bacterium]